jgi:hypothetical protein
VLYFTSVVFLNKNAGVARQARAARWVSDSWVVAHRKVMTYYTA